MALSGTVTSKPRAATRCWSHFASRSAPPQLVGDAIRFASTWGGVENLRKLWTNLLARE